jgi:ribonuclease T2
MIRQRIAAVLLLWPVAAAAQSCVLPPQVTNWRFETRGDGDPRAPVDSYILALSWSPTYCAGARERGLNADSRHQCAANQFGLVVHGLWPSWSQARSLEDQPAYCRPSQRLDPALVRAQMCRLPGATLVQHQWSKHGVCGFSSPQAYFATIDRLVAGLRLPALAALHSPGERTTAGAIRAAFTRANPALPRDAIMIDLDRRGRLDEVRLCLDRSLRWSACTRRGAPDRVAVAVPPIRD